MLLSGDWYILIIRIAEPNTDFTDYKFMCFNGKVQCSFTCIGRNTDNGLPMTGRGKNCPLPGIIRLRAVLCLSLSIMEKW